MMPSLWLSGALTYFGLGWIYAGYIVVKMLAIIGAHSDVLWDAPLYRIKWMSPVMWVVERTISTEACAQFSPCPFRFSVVILLYQMPMRERMR